MQPFSDFHRQWPSRFNKDINCCLCRLSIYDETIFPGRYIHIIIIMFVTTLEHKGLPTCNTIHWLGWCLARFKCRRIVIQQPTRRSTTTRAATCTRLSGALRLSTHIILPTAHRRQCHLVETSPYRGCRCASHRHCTHGKYPSELRGHVNKKKSPKIHKNFGSGWVGQVSNWKLTKIGKDIFIHYIITFLGEHSNVINDINAALCLCSCFYVQVFVVNYF